MLTSRLLLRAWRGQDRAPFARMNADERAMEFFPSALSSQESDPLLTGMSAIFVTTGLDGGRSNCEKRASSST
jgi:RimJ/RimL family protein N-acetyltransferase